MMKTAPRDGPSRPTRPIGDLIAAAGGRARTTCPECGRAGGFLTTGGPRPRKADEGTPKQGARYRTRLCRFCGHASQERVTVETL
jgi:hypothetical protein